MQLSQEQPKINGNIITNFRAANKWFETLPSNKAKINYKILKSQKTIKKYVNDKNKAYKTMNNTIKDNATTIKVKVDKSLNNVSNNELVVKDRIDKPNKLHPKVKMEINNATNALKAIDIKYGGIKNEYIAASTTEIELRNDLKNCIATTTNPGKYGELQKQYELIHTTVLNLHSNLDNLETQRKKLKMQIIYLKKGLIALEQIQSSDQKTPNGDVNSVINNYNDNIYALKNLDNTQNMGIKTSTTQDNKSVDNNTITDHEISTNEQSNRNLKTVDKEPQEPMMDFILYTGLGIGILGYFVSIGANAARFQLMNILLHIQNTKNFLAVVETQKKELVMRLAAEKAIETTKAKRIALQASINERKAKLAQIKSTSESGTALETVERSDAVVDVASSSGQTELIADVASSSATRTVLTDVASSSEGAATALSGEVELASQLDELMKIITPTEMEEYLALIASEEGVVNALFYSRLVMGVCICLMVVAAICIVTWLGFKLGWWRSLFG
jgi:hypothetical protein